MWILQGPMLSRCWFTAPCRREERRKHAIHGTRLETLYSRRCSEDPMFWLFRAARRLQQLGVLGINRRNAELILDHNPRRLFPVVDDKLRLRDLCVKIGVPTPAIYATIAYPWLLRQLSRHLRARDDFVIKP